MPPRSYVFANNRGGVGKSTLAFQATSQYALDNPGKSVLLVDLSHQADASALMLGGCQEPTEHTQGARTRGMQRIVGSPPEKRAAGLVRAVLEQEQAGPGIAGRFASLRSGQPPPRPPLAVADHALKVAEYHPDGGQPANLWLAPGGPDLKQAVTADNWARAAAALKAALAAAPGDWVIFYDSDAEIQERPATRLALAAAEAIIMPLSASWNDYRRVLDDPDNSLFEALKQMEAAGQAAAKIDRVVFNRIVKNKNEDTALHAASRLAKDARLSFSPVKAVLDQLSQISDHMYESGWSDAFNNWKRFYLGSEAVADEGDFSERYISSMFEVSEVAMHVSQLTGTPFCAMSASTTYLKGTSACVAGMKVPPDALEKIKTDMKALVQGW